jgi:uncharacterized protein YecT (DUF1311 family)
MKRSIAVLATILLACGASQATSNVDLAHANLELSKLYGQVMAQQHDDRDRKALRNLELAWIAFKDKQCAFETGGGDGTAQRPSDPGWPVWSDCELRVTEARIEELKGLVCVGVSACNPH